jgi:hypothetical protein
VTKIEDSQCYSFEPYKEICTRPGNQILLKLSQVTIEKEALVKLEELLGACMKKKGSYPSN